jgi:hypothetical protein
MLKKTCLKWILEAYKKVGQTSTHPITPAEIKTLRQGVDFMIFLCYNSKNSNFFRQNTHDKLQKFQHSKRKYGRGLEKRIESLYRSE